MDVGCQYCAGIECGDDLGESYESEWWREAGEESGEGGAHYVYEGGRGGGDGEEDTDVEEDGVVVGCVVGESGIGIGVFGGEMVVGGSVVGDGFDVVSLLAAGRELGRDVFSRRAEGGKLKHSVRVRFEEEFEGGMRDVRLVSLDRRRAKAEWI